ncbi:hypothetical protein HK096_006400, partial [Nowakowskiella sp. JEL0078]
MVKSNQINAKNTQTQSSMISTRPYGTNSKTKMKDALKDNSDLEPISSSVRTIATRMQLSKQRFDIVQTSAGRSRVSSTSKQGSTSSQRVSTSSRSNTTEKVESNNINSKSISNQTEENLKIEKEIDQIEKTKAIPVILSKSYHSYISNKSPEEYRYVPPAAAKYFLWDTTPVGPVQTLSPSHLTYSHLQIQPAVLRMLHKSLSRRVVSSHSLCGFLIGRQVSKNILFIDRFDSGRIFEDDVIPTLLTPGDLVIVVLSQNHNTSLNAANLFEESHFIRLFKVFDHPGVWGDKVTDISNSMPLCCICNLNEAKVA